MFDKKDYLIEQSLDEILRLKSDETTTSKVVKIEAFAGAYKDFPGQLSPALLEVFRARGIEKLYSHQAEAIQKVMCRENVVVATPTASGKTLVYNTVTLDALGKNRASKSLYLFPTKALSQDQLAELFELNEALGDNLGLYTYDGDTPQSARKAIRKKAQILITNPYMLHSGILPHHTKWVSLFENLEYVIIDELHYYTGVFGSHMANIMRRLKRICQFYGSSPVFVMSSATISNPQELAEKIIEEPVALVDQSGAPRGEKYLLFINPPVVNKNLGIRRSYISMARQITAILLKNGLQVITFANTRLITEVLVKYLKDDFEKDANMDEGKIRGYRGGYLPKKRREIEKELRDGNIRAVISTNALELGIDIGSLDAAVLASYPGTIASTWQRLGRAGRRAGKSMGILVSSSSPVDQFIVNHPGYFTGKSPEVGRVNPDNLTILIDHIKCAAFELPFVKDETFGRENLVEILEYLSENNVLFEKQNKWFWTQQGYPAESVSINRISGDNFLVIDRTEGEQVIGNVDHSSALVTLHPKAIYILEGEQYIVEELDYENRKALVKKSNADYYTDSISNTKISILEIFDETPKNKYHFFYGDVHVASQVVGFKKLKFFTNENIGAGDLDLPSQEMHSTAFWMSISNEMLQNIEITPAEKIEAITGIAYLMRHIGAVILMCDSKDLGVTVEDNLSKTEIRAGSSKKMAAFQEQTPMQQFEPFIYIFDRYPNGIGFAETLFEKGTQVLEKTLEAIDICNCEKGCPSCVGPPISPQDNHKDAARFILKLMLDRVYQ